MGAQPAAPAPGDASHGALVDAAVAQLRALGGTVTFDDAGARVVGVDLQGTAVIDADLVLLARFPELRELDLQTTQITDAGMVHVSRLGKLRALNVCRTRVTDRGLGMLADVRTLEALQISGALVTTAGIAQLTRLPRLRSLSVFDRPAGEGGEPGVVGVTRLDPQLTLRVLTAGRSRGPDRGPVRIRAAIPELLPAKAG